MPLKMVVEHWVYPPSTREIKTIEEAVTYVVLGEERKTERIEHLTRIIGHLLTKSYESGQTDLSDLKRLLQYSALRIDEVE